jgi:SAM-dependent methyltransferase
METRTQVKYCWPVLGCGTAVRAMREPLGSVSAPATPDFRSLDFDRLWRGRARVTQVERLIVRAFLATSGASRVLEIGAGVGRLSVTIQEMSREFVALDLTPEFLTRVPHAPEVAFRRVAANVYTLPFSDGSFSAAVMVRVFGFLSDPVRALREIRRVLSPGGALLVSYNPRPSIATLVDDIKVGLARRSGEPLSTMTFSRQPVVPVRPSNFPAWSMTRKEFRRTVSAAGMVWINEWPTGWEEYPGLRLLPARVFGSLSFALPSVGGFPTRFALLRSPRTTFVPERSWSEILACPACGGPLPTVGPEGEEAVSCNGCHREWKWTSGILDARWDGGRLPPTGDTPLRPSR